MRLLGEIAVLLGFISFVSLLLETVSLMYQPFWYLFAEVAVEPSGRWILSIPDLVFIFEFT